uniref:cellulase n=1 Tax=Alexandrium catenella TaxID=2925 RepID=A0A7S1QGV2_ALECA
MDSQWRWLHDARKNKYENCISGTPPAWATSICSSNQECAAGCALEGMSTSEYGHKYGISTVPGGVDLKFKNGESIGSRLYMMADEDRYEMFKLLGKEFTLDVDVSTLECGLNGAVYFVEMKEDGGMGEGGNTAGAKLGTGYCDAQCPHDLKFLAGEANVKGWHEAKAGPEGHYGYCCAEMDIWEANREATAFTTHACNIEGPLKCEGTGKNTCGDVPEDCKCCGEEDCSCCGRYKGVCDKDGCDYNHFRLGDENYYGHGSSFTVDSSKPITVVTQFLTDDAGDLSEIRRLYVQDGKVIKNSKVTNLDGFEGDSITNEMCLAQKESFDNPDDFTPKDRLAGMGKALKRGMVLVLSLWDDMKTQMDWLDSVAPVDQPDRFPVTKPGVKRGPCKNGDGDPHKIRARIPNAHVTYANIRIGEIGSTYTAKAEETVKQNNWDELPEGGTEGKSGGDGGEEHPGFPPVAGTFDDFPAFPQVSREAEPEFSEPECCTAALESSDACGTCWQGAAISSGWCAQEDRCTSDCGGTWCPNGAQKKFEMLPAGAAGLVPGRLPSAIPVLAAAAALLLPLSASLAWLRARRGAAAARSYETLEPSTGVA